MAKKDEEPTPTPPARDPMDLFLFDGGPYKREIEDGRVRVPLNCVEAQQIKYDPHLGTVNSQVDTLMMAKYPQLDKLVEGDRIYVMVLPDAQVYDNMWLMPATPYPGLEMKMDIVDVCEVYCAIQDGTDPAKIKSNFSDPLHIDFAAGLGDATIDACDKTQYGNEDYAFYRNHQALRFMPFTPRLAPLGQAQYVRLTVCKVPEAGESDCGSCTSCGCNDGLPEIQMGVGYKTIGVDKQRVALAHCTCRAPICAGECA